MIRDSFELVWLGGRLAATLALCKVVERIDSLVARYEARYATWHGRGPLVQGLCALINLAARLWWKVGQGYRVSSMEPDGGKKPCPCGEKQ